MPSYTQAVLSPDPLYLQPKSYDARSDRKHMQDIMSPGVIGQGDYLVTWVSGLTIQIAAGVSYILGQNIADQGMYREYVAASTNLAVPTNGSANPRLDQVILRVLDAAADSNAGNLYECRIEVVPGTPTAGATLANRTGAADLTALLEASKSVLLLADLLTPGSNGNLSAGAIGDRRMFSSVKGAGAYITLAQFAQILTPVDGQEVYLIVDAANGIVWHFRYNAAAGTYKWEFLGGPPLLATVGAVEATAAQFPVDLATVGPSITTPRSGEYVAFESTRALLNNTSAASNIYSAQSGLKVGAGATAVDMYNKGTVDIQAFWHERGMSKSFGATVGDVLKLQYGCEAGVLRSNGYGPRTLSILPKRIS